MWFRKKKSADHALRQLVDALAAILGESLISALVYGSRASGEFRDDLSDVNVFLILDRVAWETLKKISAPMREWQKDGHPLPVFVQKSELPMYADSLPIEFLDMQDHHKVIYGSDPLLRLRVSHENLRAQCAQELALKQLKLRQAILLFSGKPKALADMLVTSVSSILTLYRAVLRLEGDVPKGSKIAAAKELAKRVGFDGDCLDRLSEFHMRRQTDNVEDLAQHYLETVDRVLIYLGKK